MPGKTRSTAAEDAGYSAADCAEDAGYSAAEYAEDAGYSAADYAEDAGYFAAEYTEYAGYARDSAAAEHAKYPAYSAYSAAHRPRVLRPWLIALVAAAIVAGCAKKPVTAPAAVTAPRFAEFVFPTAPEGVAAADVVTQHDRAWQLLQSGDVRAADREYAAILKSTPVFYPAEAGLGYSALARKDTQGAIAHFDRALARNSSYAPALAGKGEALLSAGRTDAALDAFQAALTADPSLTALKSRVDVLKFRLVQQEISAARKAADAGQLDAARRAYASAIAASPDSAFLYRELAAVERKANDSAAALAHAQQAAKLEPSDAKALTLIGEIYESAGEWGKAADAYAAANAIEPGDALASRAAAMREKAAFAAMPDEYRAIETAPIITRAQLAALLAVRLEDLLRRAPATNPSVITDTRSSWAAPWILAVTRAGIMDVFSNHTFQPSALVHRGELAQAVSRVLTLIGAEKPRLAARWREPRPKFSDLAPSHPSYPAVARAVSAGVMAPLDDGSFQLTRPVSGSEAIDVVSKLAALARK